MSGDVTTATDAELYGTTVPPEPARMLRAGPLAARLEAGNLRYLAYAGTEILRAISFVVRDRDWGTYAPEIAGLSVEERPESFTVAYRATCRGPATLRYAVRIEGQATGSLRFDAEPVAAQVAEEAMPPAEPLAYTAAEEISDPPIMEAVTVDVASEEQDQDEEEERQPDDVDGNRIDFEPARPVRARKTGFLDWIPFMSMRC